MGRHVIFNKQWASEKEELRAASLLVDAQCLGLFETVGLHRGITELESPTGYTH